MLEEDQPPENLWGDDDGLAQWFEMVKERHRAGSSGEEPMQQVPMTQNELMKEWGL